MKITMKKPVFFHTSMIRIEVMALALSVSQCTPGRPMRRR